MKIFSLTAIGLLVSVIGCVAADDVFTWKDKEGNVHYSNSPEQEQDQYQKADLPQIEKVDLETRIDDLKNVADKTCVNRGGVSCEAGPDSDGSVICQDGSKDSIEEFKELCSEVRLSAEVILPPKKSHKMLKYFPLTVSLRNKSAIAAEGVRVEVSLLKNLNRDERLKLILEGPVKVPAYGVVEYTFSGRTFDERILRKANIQIICDNCWNPPLATN